MDGKKLTDEQMENITGGEWDRSDPLMQQRLDYVEKLLVDLFNSNDDRRIGLFNDIWDMNYSAELYNSNDIDKTLAKYGFPPAE